MSHTVGPVYYEHLGTSKKCPGYQGVLIFQVSLYDKAPFGTITKCVDYASALFSSVLINRFHCKIQIFFIKDASLLRIAYIHSNHVDDGVWPW